MLLTKLFKGLQCTITYNSSQVQCLFLLNTMEFKRQAFFFITNCCCKFHVGLLVFTRVYELLQSQIWVEKRSGEAHTWQVFARIMKIPDTADMDMDVSLA